MFDKAQCRSQNTGTQTLLVRTLFKGKSAVSVHLYMFFCWSHLPSSGLRDRSTHSGPKRDLTQQFHSDRCLCPQETRKHASIRTLTAAPFTRAEKEKPPGIPQQNMVCPWKGRLLGSKRNEVPRQAPTWINLENIPSEKSWPVTSDSAYLSCPGQPSRCGRKQIGSCREAASGHGGTQGFF